ncbi:MAG: aminotransferase class III-fold pyridoxal phosphate-dependent enzyme [Propionibacteriales bacterium]|nr:aminotransferase class III-fold pyridoxal phosphate-dependent enzyme [Propionibacteriales bacterium]
MTTDADAVDEALATAQSRYLERRPGTRDLHEQARELLPGGNTRTVLYHRPVPLRVARAWDGMLEDVDGHTYVDLLGNYSAGLYGHSHPVIVAAVTDALQRGVGPGAHHAHEIELARAVSERFPSIERMRFTNSGTEANLMAVSAARVFTGRERVLVFRGGYHGGLLTFLDGASAVNAPYDVLIAPYNATETAVRMLEEHADTTAAVLVEPMLGAGGCIPGDPEFLRALRTATRELGSLLIFDEVMTSRIGRGGLQDRLGISPDLTTLGKYLGGGMSFGAFGGREDVMALFDPSRPDALSHAGTFNNNLLSMIAGHAALTRLYPPDVAEFHTARGDDLRTELAGVFRRLGAPFQVTGIGSLLNVHATTEPITRREDLAGSDERLKQLLFLDLLETGYYLSARGYMALSLAVTDEQLEGFLTSVEKVLAARPGLLSGAR